MIVNREQGPARSALVEAAQAAARTKGSYLSAQYHRLPARRGKKKAIVAVAHTILVVVYHLLRDNVSYQELGGQYFDQRERQSPERRLVRRLEALGNKVTVEPIVTAAGSRRHGLQSSFVVRV